MPEPPNLNRLSALTIILSFNQVTAHLKRCNSAACWLRIENTESLARRRVQMITSRQKFSDLKYKAKFYKNEFKDIIRVQHAAEFI